MASHQRSSPVLIVDPCLCGHVSTPVCGNRFRSFRKSRMRSVEVHSLLPFVLNITPAKGSANSIKGKGIRTASKGSPDTKATLRISSVVGFSCAASKSKITNFHCEPSRQHRDAGGQCPAIAIVRIRCGKTPIIQWYSPVRSFFFRRNSRPYKAPARPSVCA